MGNQNSSPPAAKKNRRRENPQENALMKIQMGREAGIVVQNDSCLQSLASLINVKAEDFKSAPEFLSRINEFLLKEKLENQYYDNTLMSVIRCLLTVGLIGDQYLAASTFAKDVLTELRHLGQLRPEGIALLAGFKGARDVFVIKSPRTALDDALIHEYFVATGGSYVNEDGEGVVIRGTNYLRRYCLNYSQIIGAFRCTPPNVDPGSGRLNSWCNLNADSDSFVNYLIYEKIPGVDVQKYASQMSFKQFLSIVMQICYALEIGYVVNGFTHYDLHTENVILREVSTKDNPVYLPFYFGNRPIYIKATHIATIIDYGRCHVQSLVPEESTKLASEHFGYKASLAQSYGIYDDRSRPFYDIFKFLGFLLHNLYTSSNPVFDRVWPCMRFFGFKDSISVLAYIKGEGYDSRYSLGEHNAGNFCLSDPYQSSDDVCMREQETKIGDFVTFMIAQFPRGLENVLFKEVPEGSKVIQCGQECLSPKQTLKSIIYEENAESVSEILSGKYNRNTPEGIFSLLVYRQNLKDRYLHFIFNSTPYQYHEDLKEILDQLDASFDKGELDLMQKYMVDRVNQAMNSFEAIKDGVYYDPNPRLDKNGTARKLIDINKYVDTTAIFSKHYADAIEAYEYYEILFKIVNVGEAWRLEAVAKIVTDQLSPLFRQYREIMNSLHDHLGMIEIHEEASYFFQNLYIKTF